MTRTPPNHDEHTLAIAAALRELERRLDLLVQALSHESAPVSVEAARTEREARRLVCEAYATIDYAPDDQANESPVCLGVIGGSAAVIDRAEAVNAAKVELRERCKAISHLRVRVPVKDGKGRTRGEVPAAGARDPARTATQRPEPARRLPPDSRS